MTPTVAPTVTVAACVHGSLSRATPSQEGVWQKYFLGLSGVSNSTKPPGESACIPVHMGTLVHVRQRHRVRALRGRLSEESRRPAPSGDGRGEGENSPSTYSLRISVSTATTERSARSCRSSASRSFASASSIRRWARFMSSSCGSSCRATDGGTCFACFKSPVG